MLEVKRGQAGYTGEEHRGNHKYEDWGHWSSFRCSSENNVRNPGENKMRTVLKVSKSYSAHREQDNSGSYESRRNNHRGDATFLKEEDPENRRPHDAGFS